MAALYLIPTTLGETPVSGVLPATHGELVGRLRHFVVEDIRTARRHLKKMNPSIVIDELHFSELNEHTLGSGLLQMLAPLAEGFDVGLLSEAGCPGVADPGADLVKMAHDKGFKVVPLVGPSSILLALMASGMNGQNFAFVGYLPVKPNERVHRIKELERLSGKERQTQIFIEAPYRNVKLVEDILAGCLPTTRLCIAVDLTTDDEFVVTKSIAAWKKGFPDLHKRPAIFLLQSS
ncbi:MAG: SAM-dependent methyltransferase [Marinilabiliales bacterium]|nr:SAM-dependent methyltransferase [Marinilabiliales bacterium]